MRRFKARTFGASSATAGRGLLRRVLGDRSGAAAIEFALVAVPFFGFVLFVIQIGMYHFSQQSLDSATRRAARQIMTGTVPAGAKTLSGFKTTLLCPNVLWKISCSDIVVNAYRVAKTSNAANGTGVYQFVNAQTKTLAGPVSDPKQNTFCLGGPGDYVFLDVAYAYPDFTGGLLGLTTGSFLLRSSTFIYNEPTIGTSSC